jgi:hypothetical protein
MQLAATETPRPECSPGRGVVYGQVAWKMMAAGSR